MSRSSRSSPSRSSRVSISDQPSLTDEDKEDLCSKLRTLDDSFSETVESLCFFWIIYEEMRSRRVANTDWRFIFDATADDICTVIKDGLALFQMIKRMPLQLRRDIPELINRVCDEREISSRSYRKLAKYMQKLEDQRQLVQEAVGEFEASLRTRLELYGFDYEDIRLKGLVAGHVNMDELDTHVKKIRFLKKMYERERGINRQCF